MDSVKGSTRKFNDFFILVSKIMSIVLYTFTLIVKDLLSNRIIIINHRLHFQLFGHFYRCYKIKNITSN